MPVMLRGTTGTAYPNNRAGTLAGYYALNVLLLAVIGHGYLANIPAGTSALGWGITLLAYIANFAFLALLPMLLTLPALLTRRSGIILTIAVFWYGLANVFVYADSIIFQLWRIHFNGMIVNLLTTPGAGDTVTAGKGTVITTLLIIAGIFLAEFGLLYRAAPKLRVWVAPRLTSHKSVALFCVGAFSLMFLDKAVYDIGDLRDDVEVIRLRQILPLYQTVTIHRLAARVFGLKTSPHRRLKMGVPSAEMNYPIAPLTFAAQAPRPNVVIIAIEGARADMLTPAIMPNLSHWGEQHLVFDNHFSSGNATRYGIFRIVLRHLRLLLAASGRRTPGSRPDQRALKQRGYNFRILGCTDLNYPEFRSTCFIDVPNAITDKWPGERVNRDRLMTDAFVQFIDQQSTPFLAFMFYDASHQPYRYPSAHAVFDAGQTTDELNYVKIVSNPAGIPFVFNRYKNSLHYIDEQIGRALQSLADHQLLDNTLVFIAGDHGEEFFELGLFGHDSTFDHYQTHTLMVAHVPGQSPRHVQTLTSHMDVPATILTYAGRPENPLSDYPQGRPLLAAEDPPYLYLASWEIGAIMNRSNTTVFGLAAYNADTTVYDNTTYKPLPNQRDSRQAAAD